MRKSTRTMVEHKKTQLKDWLRIHWKNYDIPLWSLSISTILLIIVTFMAKR